MILANLVVGENVVPEFIQKNCTAEKLAPALRDILRDSPARQRQVEAFAGIDAIMLDGRSAAQRARRRYRAGDDAKSAAGELSRM